MRHSQAERDAAPSQTGSLRRVGRLPHPPADPRECFRLQGWTDDRIDQIIHLHSDHQLYKQAGNGVTVPVVEAIGKRIAAMHREVTGSH